MGSALHKLLFAMDRRVSPAGSVVSTAANTSPHGSSASLGSVGSVEPSAQSARGSAAWEEDLSDEFMAAVLSFVTHMGGRLDALDNARLYDEFRSFTSLAAPSYSGVQVA